LWQVRGDFGAVRELDPFSPPDPLGQGAGKQPGQSEANEDEELRDNGQAAGEQTDKGEKETKAPGDLEGPSKARYDAEDGADFDDDGGQQQAKETHGPTPVRGPTGILKLRPGQTIIVRAMAG
jgi:hypothetical protein